MGAIVKAIARFSDDDLATLMAFTAPTSGVSPGLLAYLEHAVDWEQHRRQRRDFPLREPEAAIDNDEVPYAIASAGKLALHFSSSEPVTELLWSVVEALRGRREIQ